MTKSNYIQKLNVAVTAAFLLTVPGQQSLAQTVASSNVDLGPLKPLDSRCAFPQIGCVVDSDGKGDFKGDNFPKGSTG